MIAPRYRTLDGEEVELPLVMDAWVLVPRLLARFDPELAWTLDYEDAPEPDDADPRLDFSGGALVVPVERWNEHAELEPDLGPCYPAAADRASVVCADTSAPLVRPDAGGGGYSLGRRLALVAARSLVVVLAALASAYVFGVGAWLWALRDGISGPEVSMGLVLVGAAVVLAWFAGVVGAGRQSGTHNAPAPRTWRELRDGLVGLTADPVGILRTGMALQLTGFAVLIFLR